MSPREIKFILEKSGEILDNIRVEACLVLREPSQPWTHSFPGLWDWQWDWRLYPSTANRRLSSLWTSSQGLRGQDRRVRRSEHSWAKAVHTSENISNLLWGTEKEQSKSNSVLACTLSTEASVLTPTAVSYCPSDLIVRWVPNQRC